MKDYDNASKVIERGFKYLETHKIDIIKADFLFNKGNIFIGQNKIDSAEYIYQQLLALDTNVQDQHTITKRENLMAKIYTAREKYADALNIYKNIIEQSDSTEIELKMTSFQSAFEISKKMEDFEKASKYLEAYIDLNKQKEEDSKRQKTTYLKIKFDSEQKDKANAILEAEIINEKEEQRILYALIALITLFSLILLGAFYQKWRFNKKLKTEVLKRTINLKQSNEQLFRTNKAVSYTHLTLPTKA